MKTVRVVYASILFLSWAVCVWAQAKQPVTFRQLAELTASDGQPGDELGYALAMSGNTLVVGAPQFGGSGGVGVGKAYVYVRPTSGWTTATQTAELTPSDGTFDQGFGWRVAISGSTIAVDGGASSDGNKSCTCSSNQRAGGRT
jgi:hypothetical protein